MKLTELRISNFKCFGAEPEAITFDGSSTIVIGPNGSGKTAILQALARVFASNSTLRKIRRDDFHVPLGEKEIPEERKLSIEVDFTLPEAADDDADSNTLPSCFNHMRLSEDGETLTIRYRLEATMGVDGDIQEDLYYIIGSEDDGTQKMARVSRAERNHIAVHYIPARRDPNDHIQASTTSLLGRIIRAIDWSQEDEKFEGITSEIKTLISGNNAIEVTNKKLSKEWKKLHKGSHFKDANLIFGLESLEQLRNHVSVEFNPAHAAQSIDYSFLSDGQKSLLYLSLVSSFIEISRVAMAEAAEGEEIRIDTSKLNPPIFSIIAVEEPENSLSPHYLGRINTLLKKVSAGPDAQSIVTTHSPSMLQRVAPEKIRHTRLGEDRTTSVKEITLPPKSKMDAYKYIREGILSNPEVYFSRFVVLGEGASEAIILPKLFEAAALPVDENGITIAQLGGRHVNYMWKLLNDLGIPHATLLDLDLSRYHGGWGRIKYALKQLKKVKKVEWNTDSISNWDESSPRDEEPDDPEEETWINILRDEGVFFSEPLDLDFSMILSYSYAYGIEDDHLEAPDDSTYKSVLGKSHTDTSWYEGEEAELFDSYHNLFKLGSKPAAHISALSKLDSDQLLEDLPEEYEKLIESVRAKLLTIHE